MLILRSAYACRTSSRDVASIESSSSAVSGPPTLTASSADRTNGVSAHQKPAEMVAVDARHAMTAAVTVTTSTAIAPIRIVVGTRRVIAADLRLRRFVRQIRKPRQPPLPRKGPDRIEKPLEPVEAFLPLDGCQRLAPPRPRVSPSRRHRRLGVCDIVHLFDDEARLLEQTLIAPRGKEEIKADRAPDANLFARHRSGDDDGIGVEEASTRLENAVPVGEQLRAAGQVIDCLLYTSPSPRDS